jgi:putative methionine-R-sulfoxide reductase with GAF domain
MRLDAVSLLPQVIRRLLAISDPDLLLHECCTLAKDALGADEVMLFLVDGSRQYIVEHEVVGRKISAKHHKLRIRDEGITGWVAAHKLAQVVPDVRQDKRYVGTFASTRSEAAVPILAGEQVLGVLNFESRHLDFYQMTDLPLLEFLASQVAIALKMAELERRVLVWKDRMGALQNISRLGGGVVPLETMLRRVVDAVRMTCGGHYAAVFQADYEREELVLLAQSSVEPLEIKPGARQKFGRGLVGKAFAIGEAVNMRDVRNDPMHFALVPGVISEVCVPIRVGDNSIGILDAQAPGVGEFTPDEVSFLETVARFLAPALQAAAPAPRH